MGSYKMKELLFSVTKKDLEVQTFRAGGKGGQNQNKVESGVRIIHKESGAVGEARDQRTQLQNKHNAFTRLINSPKFKAWVKIEIAYKSGQLDDIHKRVDSMMKLENIKVEYCIDGKWVLQ